MWVALQCAVGAALPEHTGGSERKRRSPLVPSGTPAAGEGSPVTAHGSAVSTLPVDPSSAMPRVPVKCCCLFKVGPGAKRCGKHYTSAGE